MENWYIAIYVCVHLQYLWECFQHPFVVCFLFLLARSCIANHKYPVSLDPSSHVCEGYGLETMYPGFSVTSCNSAWLWANTYLSISKGGGGVLVEWESPVPSSGSVRNLPFALPEEQIWAMPFMVTQASWPRTCMKTSYVLEMQHFLGYQIKMNWTELKPWGGYVCAISLARSALSSVRKLMQNAWTSMSSIQSVPTASAGSSRSISVSSMPWSWGGAWLSSSQCFASSSGHEDMKWVASSSWAQQSLQDESPRVRPLLRELNLGSIRLQTVAAE